MDESLDDTMIDNTDDDDTVNDQLDAIVIPSDIDWNNIPASYSDSIWEISYDYDLEGLAATIPENVVLKFTGGSLNNYTSISGVNTKIDTGSIKSFDGTGIFVGTWSLEEVYPEWYGAVGDGAYYDADTFNSAVRFLNTMGGGDLILTTGKDYAIDKEILLYSHINILGHNANMSVTTTTYDVSPNRFFPVLQRFTLIKDQ